MCSRHVVQLFVSNYTLREIEDVLFRPPVRYKFARLTDDRAERFLRKVAGLAAIVHEPPPVFPFARDPDDSPYLDLAIACQSHYLVSRDNDLLDLAKPGDPDGMRLRELAPDLRIVTPAEFLRAIGQ